MGCERPLRVGRTRVSYAVLTEEGARASSRPPARRTARTSTSFFGARSDPRRAHRRLAHPAREAALRCGYSQAAPPPPRSEFPLAASKIRPCDGVVLRRRLRALGHLSAFRRSGQVPGPQARARPAARALRSVEGADLVSVRVGCGKPRRPGGSGARGGVLDPGRRVLAERGDALARSSSARVTSDQHQSGEGSTTGRVRRLAGNRSTCRFGDIRTGALRRSARSWNAVPAMPPSLMWRSLRTGCLGELGGVGVPRLPGRGGRRRRARAASRLRRSSPITSRRGNGEERLGPEKPKVEPFVARSGPRDGGVEAAVEDAGDLNVTWHDPLVDTDIQRGRCRELLREPAHVADAQGAGRACDALLGSGGEIENLACIGQEHPSGPASARHDGGHGRRAACPGFARAP